MSKFTDIFFIEPEDDDEFNTIWKYGTIAIVLVFVVGLITVLWLTKS